MTWANFISSVRRQARDETGASLIEYTVVISLFLLVYFAVLDFGRLGFNWVMTEKAMQRAARIATVRPPVCIGVPQSHTLATGSTSNFGTLCRVSGTCTAEPTRTCALGAATDFSATFPCTSPIVAPTLGNNPTQAEIDARNLALRRQSAQEIWCTLEPILPSNATPNNIFVEYRYNPNLGFAGGPYTPIVTVGVVNAGSNVGAPLRFEFLTPIPGLAAIAGGVATTNIDAPGTGGSGLPSIPFPNISVSLPGEDLNTGNDG